MSAWNQLIVATAKRCGLPSTGLTPERRATIALLRAGLDLSKSLGDGREHAPAQVCLFAWLRELDPSASPEFLDQLLSESPSPAEFAWASAFAQHEDAALLPPPLLLLSLLALLPAGSTQASRGWPLLDELAGCCGVPPLWLAEARGCLDRVAAPQVQERFQQEVNAFARASPLARQLAAGLRTQADGTASRAPRNFSNAFAAAREQFGRCIQTVLDAAQPLDLEVSSLKRLQGAIENDRFRVAVLGEFKRGKSTLTNALVGQPDLLPAETLPSTSALIELRYGDQTTFEERVEGGHYEPRDPADFRTRAGAAAQLSERRERGELVEEDVPRWRVHVPSPFLTKATVELVDTPGLGEDPVRDESARSEALRTDAAILVFKTTQLASRQELDLVESMGAKLGNLILAINYADQVDEQEWPRLKAHVLSRLRARQLEIPPERIVFVSARLAENALRGAPVAVWAVERIEALREAARQHLFEHSGQRKATIIAAHVAHVVQEGRRKVDIRLKHHAQQLEQLDQLAARRAEASRLYEQARAEVRAAAAILAESESAAQALKEAFDAGLPAILQQVEAQKDGWTAENSPITSPKKHVEEVAKRAEQSFVRAVGDWVKTEAGAVLERELAARFEAVSKQLSSLRHYLALTHGADAESVIEEIKRQALEDAFDGRIADVGAGQAAFKAALMGVISLAVGYIVADIVLYYMLGVISGFLNPFLMGAAIVSGVGLYAWKGKDWVKGWVRSTVYEKLAEGVQGERARQAIHAALRKAAKEVFQKMSNAFVERARQILEELREQDMRHTVELEAKKRDLGDPAALQAELRRMEALAAGARLAFDELEQLAARIREAAEAETGMSAA